MIAKRQDERGKEGRKKASNLEEKKKPTKKKEIIIRSKRKKSEGTWAGKKKVVSGPKKRTVQMWEDYREDGKAQMNCVKTFSQDKGPSGKRLIGGGHFCRKHLGDARETGFGKRGLEKHWGGRSRPGGRANCRMSYEGNKGKKNSGKKKNDWPTRGCRAQMCWGEGE